jgi:hypothetical protein
LVSRLRLEQKNAQLSNEQQRQKVNTIRQMNFGQQALQGNLGQPIPELGRLRNSIITNNLTNIGKFQIYEKQINLNADKKRMWMGELDGINDKSNGSIPLSFNRFTLDQI